MRVIAFGSEMIMQRVSTSLAGEGIDVVSTSDRPQAMALLKHERLDLAVVDALVEDVEASCRCIRELWGIPVVLIVRERQADWERLQSLDTDGYIPERAGAAELAARLRAVVRHRSERRDPGLDCLTLGVEDWAR
ncbi:MAG: hypothetical protein E3J81_10375 [Dehalococcoidia bacterium]|nr:MAG: hypothetical protein E3J81_10375 [Dehalococcoidia bacterium]